MLNCKEVSKLVSESLERKLTWWQRVNLWMHLGMCRICWRFRRDLFRIRDATRQHAGDVEYDRSDLSTKLSDASRDRMKRLIASRM